MIRSRAVINWQALGGMLGICRHVQNQWRLREIAPTPQNDSGSCARQTVFVLAWGRARREGDSER